jgi:hypothetical protein
MPFIQPRQMSTSAQWFGLGGNCTSGPKRSTQLPPVQGVGNIETNDSGHESPIVNTIDSEHTRETIPISDQLRLHKYSILDVARRSIHNKHMPEGSQTEGNDLFVHGANYSAIVNPRRRLIGTIRVEIRGNSERASMP